MSDMHYRPRPRGYKFKPFIPTKVKVATISSSINSGKYNVFVFYTDTKYIVNAPILKMVEGEDAIALSIQLLNEWADIEGKVEKCLLSTKKGILHEDFLEYSNLYAKLNSDRHELIALVRK